MGLNKFFIKEIAVMKNMYDDTVDTVKIKRNKSSFEYDNGTYNVSRNKAYRDTIKGLTKTTHRYFYYIGNPNPLGFYKDSRTIEPLMDSELYNKLLESEVLKKLNTVNMNWFKDIKLGHVVVGLAVVAAIIYVLTQGTG